MQSVREHGAVGWKATACLQCGVFNRAGRAGDRRTTRFDPRLPVHQEHARCSKLKARHLHLLPSSQLFSPVGLRSFFTTHE